MLADQSINSCDVALQETESDAFESQSSSVVLMPSGSVEDADAIAEMPVSVTVLAPTDVVALTPWSVSIEMVQAFY